MWNETSKVWIHQPERKTSALSFWPLLWSVLSQYCTVYARRQFSRWPTKRWLPWTTLRPREGPSHRSLNTGWRSRMEPIGFFQDNRTLGWNAWPHCVECIVMQQLLPAFVHHWLDFARWCPSLCPWFSSSFGTRLRSAGPERVRLSLESSVVLYFEFPKLKLL